MDTCFSAFILSASSRALFLEKHNSSLQPHLHFNEKEQSIFYSRAGKNTSKARMTWRTLKVPDSLFGSFARVSFAGLGQTSV